MSKHTPGPWTYKNREIHAGVLVAEVYEQSAGKPPCPAVPLDVEESKANGRLIATAPKLAEALRGLVERSAAFYSRACLTFGRDPLLEAELTDARAALKLAGIKE